MRRDEKRFIHFSFKFFVFKIVFNVFVAVDQRARKTSSIRRIDENPLRRIARISCSRYAHDSSSQVLIVVLMNSHFSVDLKEICVTVGHNYSFTIESFRVIETPIRMIQISVSVMSLIMIIDETDFSVLDQMSDIVHIDVN